jgi:hypothetical protein
MKKVTKLPQPNDFSCDMYNEEEDYFYGSARARTQATSEQAKEARKATFDLLTKTDSSAIEHFQIQVESIQIDRPNIIFGTAMIKAGETQTRVKFA